MTIDVIALCARPPDPGVLLAALGAAAPELRIATEEPGALIRLFAEDGTALVAIASPRFVPVAGEARRLLNVPDAPQPLWWVEARAPVAAGAVVARRFVAALISQTGGTSWQSRER